jgi:hypothetical protein
VACGQRATSIDRIRDAVSVTRHRLDTRPCGDRCRLVACAVVVFAAVAGVAAQRLVEHDPRPGDRPVDSLPAVGTVRGSGGPTPGGERWWAHELDRLDRLRAAAWRRGDIGRLRSVYLPGSAVLIVDRRHLQSYIDRGFTVRGARTRVLAVHVLDCRPTLVRLAVVDRLADAVARDSTGRELALPHVRARRQLVELRRVDGRWRIAGVAAHPPPSRWRNLR